jgi:hypothetical protein
MQGLQQQITDIMCRCCHTISIDNNDSKIKIGLPTLVPFFYFQLNKKIAAIVFYMRV